jgi:ArsR family transcriptional regulator, arsenate/arsenite/antimonite-responsive transcriptional repressor
MDISRATIIMSALAQPTRLRTYKLLLEAGEDGLASGAIAASVAAPQNTMSSHLTILTHAGLVRRQQEGRVVRYRAVRDEVAQIGPFLAA